MKNRKTKFSNNQILGFGVLVLSAVVLVKLYNTANNLDNTANEWSEIGNKINAGGLKSLL
jgi:hypothetical protein